MTSHQLFMVSSGLKQHFHNLFLMQLSSMCYDHSTQKVTGIRTRGVVLIISRVEWERVDTWDYVICAIR